MRARQPSTATASSGCSKEARDAEPAARARLLSEALELWRGPALADLDEEDFARLEAARLDELRVAAQEDLIDAELELGRHAALVGELEAARGNPPDCAIASAGS